MSEIIDDIISCEVAFIKKILAIVYILKVKNYALGMISTYRLRAYFWDNLEKVNNFRLEPLNAIKHKE